MAVEHPFCNVGNIGFSLRGSMSEWDRQELEAKIKQHIARNLTTFTSQLESADCTKKSNGKAYLQLRVDKKTGAIYNNSGPHDNESSDSDWPDSDSDSDSIEDQNHLQQQEDRKLMSYLHLATLSLNVDSQCLSDLVTHTPNSQYKSKIKPKSSLKHFETKNNANIINSFDTQGQFAKHGEHSIEAAIVFAASNKVVNTKHSKHFICKKQMANNSITVLHKPIAESASIASKTTRKSLDEVVVKPKNVTNPTTKSITESSAVPKSKTEKTSLKSTGQKPSIPTKTGILSSGYNCVHFGNLFKQTFPDMKGGFEIFYDHGESHCRKILTALGFKELTNTDEMVDYKRLEEMIIFWCNGKLAATKRRPEKMGFYIINRIRYRGLITNKCSLVRTMNEFEHAHSALVPKGLEQTTFLPPTVHLNSGDYMRIFDMIKRHRMFLLKPGYTDCGKGITLFRSDGTMNTLAAFLEKEYSTYAAKDLMMQTYIDTPLLLDRKKFDIRVFVLIVPNQQKEAGVYAFFHPGYIRLSCRDFNLKSNNLLIHLTNQAVQCKDKLYAQCKEKTVWSPDTFNEYLNERLAELQVPCKDWVSKMLIPRMKAILAHIISISSSSMVERTMAFELFGCDFMVDQRFNVWLLEINSDPSLCKSTAVLQQVITAVTEEAVAVAVEVLQRSIRKLPIRNLVTLQDFSKIFSHNNDSVIKSVFSRARIRMPSGVATSAK